MNRRLQRNGSSPLFETRGLFFKEFPSDFRQVRFFTLLIVQKAPAEIREINLLEQQISELIKNAIKHGNRSDPQKKIRIWYSFSTSRARLIIEDEGEGFRQIDAWNAFHEKRSECFRTQDFDTMAEYVSFRTADSDDNDGGNALFAAVEYWEGGVVFSEKANRVAVMKSFPRRRTAIELNGDEG